jgi:hypothetical protein
MTNYLVSPRPFKRSNHHKIKKNFNRVKLIYPKINFSIKAFRIVILAIIFSYWIFFVIKNTFFKKENYIQNLSYSKESVDKFNDPTLYSAISKALKWENYYIVWKLKKKATLRSIQNEFPVVRNMKVVKSEPYSAAVWIDFYEPDIIIKLWERRFAVMWDYSYEIFSGNTIWDDTFYAELPQYTSWIDSLYWLFHEISQNQFIHDMHFFAEAFPDYDRIVYLPGSSMTVVILKSGLRIYVNNQNSLTWQIENYNLIKQYYKDFYSLKTIDLWSLQWDKIIVNK